MPDLNQIYREQAARYDALVSCEDYEHHLLPAIQNIAPVTSLDIVESGAGTGRVTALLAPLAHSVHAFDLSPHMLAVAAANLRAAQNCHFTIADHRALPLPDNCADLLISGWSICMLVVNYKETWQEQVTRSLNEFRRVLRPGGTLILIETQGTGAETPKGNENLDPYYDLLEKRGFSSTWIRTDFAFLSEIQARESIGFFFGEPAAETMVSEAKAKASNNETTYSNNETKSAQCGMIIPECTGLWWTSIDPGR